MKKIEIIFIVGISIFCAWGSVNLGDAVADWDNNREWKSSKNYEVVVEKSQKPGVVESIVNELSKMSLLELMNLKEKIINDFEISTSGILGIFK